MKRNKNNSQLKVFEQHINNIALILDPCKLCDVYIKNGEGYDHGHQDENGDWEEGTCKHCCWYYDSKFKIRGEA